MKNLSYILTFVAGAVVGSAVTYKVVSERYEEDIRSVKEVYSNKEKEPVKKDTEPAPKKEVASTEYSKILNTNEYGAEEGGKKMDITPYFISIDEYGEMDDYEQVQLFYYKDGVLADELDNVIKDVDDAIGEDSLEYLDECEDSVVFIRNENTKIDYEVLISDREFSEIV